LLVVVEAVAVATTRLGMLVEAVAVAVKFCHQQRHSHLGLFNQF
jgi:hypothetical protein